MISRPSSPRLCSACRSDLLALFENGLSATCRPVPRFAALSRYNASRNLSSASTAREKGGRSAETLRQLSYKLRRAQQLGSWVDRRSARYQHTSAESNDAGVSHAARVADTAYREAAFRGWPADELDPLEQDLRLNIYKNLVEVFRENELGISDETSAGVKKGIDGIIDDYVKDIAGRRSDIQPETFDTFWGQLRAWVPRIVEQEASVQSAEPEVEEELAQEKNEQHSESVKEDEVSSQTFVEDSQPYIPMFFRQDGGNLSNAPYTRRVDDPDKIMQELRSKSTSVDEIARLAREAFGESLPENMLNEEELNVYVRMYGEPAPMLDEEEVTYEEEAEADKEESTKNVLYSEDGQELDYEMPEKDAPGASDLNAADAQSQTIDEAFLRNQSEVARLVDGEIVDEDDAYDEVEDAEDVPESRERYHPLTREGKFETYPRAVILPEDEFVMPVRKILREFSNKHVKDMSERKFGGPGLPDSPLTPQSGIGKQQKPVQIDPSQHNIGEMEANAYMAVVMPPTYASLMSVLVETRKRLGSQWIHKLFAKEADGGHRILDAGSAGAGIIAWREVLRAEWERMHDSDTNPPPAPQGDATVLTGSKALEKRSARLLDNTTFIPRLPDPDINYAKPEDAALAQSRKKFDVILAPHTLWHLNEEYLRRQVIQSLWSLLNEGGVLILLEKGVPRGFEVLAGARRQLLARMIPSQSDSDGGDGSVFATELNSPDEGPFTKKGKGTIVAPCPNHAPCPMYPIPGVARARKDFCYFQQRYTRPDYLQRILGARERNYDDAEFSYVSVLKGYDLRETGDQEAYYSTASNGTIPSIGFGEGATATEDAFEGQAIDTYPRADLSSQSTEFTPTFTSRFPRAVFPAIKRKGHVSIDLCTPSGTIERWTIPKSYSTTAYRDARKARWGDLWAFGAKTRQSRNLRLGGTGSKELRKMENRNPKVRTQRQAQGLMGKAKEQKREEAMEKMEEADEFKAHENEMEEMLNDRDDRTGAGAGRDDLTSRLEKVGARLQARAAAREATISTSATATPFQPRATTADPTRVATASQFFESMSTTPNRPPPTTPRQPQPQSQSQSSPRPPRSTAASPSPSRSRPNNLSRSADDTTTTTFADHLPPPKKNRAERSPDSDSSSPFIRGLAEEALQDEKFRLEGLRIERRSLRARGRAEAKFKAAGGAAVWGKGQRGGAWDCGWGV